MEDANKETTETTAETIGLAAASNTNTTTSHPEEVVPQQPPSAAAAGSVSASAPNTSEPAPKPFVMSMPKIPQGAEMVAPHDPDKVEPHILATMPKIPAGAEMTTPIIDEPLPAPLPVEMTQPEVEPQSPAMTVRPMMAVPLDLSGSDIEPSMASTSDIPEGTAPQDMSQVLAGIKLPERHEFRALGDIPTPQKQDPTVIPLEPPAPVVTRMPRPDVPQDALAAVHTFRADVQDVVKDQNISLIHAASLESDRKHTGDSALPNLGAQQRMRRTIGIVFAIMLFLGLGSAALFGIAFVAQQHNTQVAVPEDTSLIFAEQHTALSIDNAVPANVKQNIADLRLTSNAPLGAITRVIPTLTTKAADGTVTQRLATTQEFLKALGVSVSDDFYRAVSDQFFFGIHTVDKNVPVLVIPVTSYDRAFAAMLAWEPQMNADLAPAFTAVPSSVAGPNGPEPRTFEDTVMRNYDVRALKDDNNYIQLYYSFPTPNILIIAESPYSFSEVLSRLQSGRKL